MDHGKVRTLVIYALFIGMIFVLALTPIGYITTPTIEITLIHIPVILGSFFLGIRGGMILGFFFGLSSLMKALMTPTPLSMILLGADTGFGLYNLVLILAVIFLPRILVGVVSALLYRVLTPKNNIVGMAVASAAGSLTNTVLFLGILYLLAAPLLATAFGMDVAGVATILFAATGLFNGGLEAVAAVLICTAAGKALQSYMKRRMA